jgi:hypothetical protein
MVFGDGVFSEIPVGIFRAYVRASNGLQYIINPAEMQNVVLPISYIDRNGNLQTITFTCGITQPVSNAKVVKALMPSNNVLQQDTTHRIAWSTGKTTTCFRLLFTIQLSRAKAVNRASIGTSRYLDLVDNTGKYSSTNTFSVMVLLWKSDVYPTILFSWTNRNDIAEVITNQVQPDLAGATVKQFYYANFPRETVNTGATAGYTWNQSTTLANETTGYFRNTTTSATWPDGTPIPIGDSTSGVFKYVVPGALMKFVPPQDTILIATTDWFKVPPCELTNALGNLGQRTGHCGRWHNGGLGNLTRAGPVTINNFVPTGAIIDTIIPLFVSDLPNDIEQQITQQILLNRQFGLGYDNDGSITGTPYTWYLITSTNLNFGTQENITPWSQAVCWQHIRCQS